MYAKNWGGASILPGTSPTPGGFYSPGGTLLNRPVLSPFGLSKSYASVLFITVV